MNKDKIPFKFDEKRMQELLEKQSMIDPNEVGTPPGGKRSEPTIEDINFHITPEELIAHLNKFVVGQSKAIDTVATKICTHFHRMKLERINPDLPRIVGHVKANMLLIGPTGVGKTYMMKLIADQLNVPFVKGDATKFSETGYVGGDVEDLVRELVYQADDNIKLAEYGIIYIDEIDKIASGFGSWSGPDVSRSGVQRNLLKLMEETEVDMKVPHDLASQMEAVMETQRTGHAVRKKVNTRNILFVMSGAFVDLPEIIAKRLKKGGFGFTGDAMVAMTDTSFILDKMHSLDLIQYGFESEFVGRLPVITNLNTLDEEGLFKILNGSNSAVVQGKKRDFISYGIELNFDESALRFIAKEALNYRTGARGLVTVVERILMPFERSLPSTGIKQLLVTEEICHDSEAFLKDLVTRDVLNSFAIDFSERTGIDLSFSPGAESLLLNTSTNSGVRIKRYLSEILKDYEYGLNLTGKKSFSVTTSVLNDPKAYLDKLIKQSYSHKHKKAD